MTAKKERTAAPDQQMKPALATGSPKDKVRVDVTRLVERRNDLGLRQRDVANRTGLNQSDISRMERGIKTDPARRAAVADALGVSDDWLAGKMGVAKLKCEPVETAADGPALAPPAGVVQPETPEPAKPRKERAPRAAVPDPFEDVIAALRLEHEAGQLEVTTLVGQIRAATAAARATLTDLLGYVDIATVEFEKVARKTATERVRSRVLGSEAGPTGASPDALVEQLRGVESGLVEVGIVLLARMSELLGVPVAPLPSAAEAESSSVPTATSGPTGKPEQVVTEPNVRLRALIIGGSFAPHPDLVNAVHREFGDEVEWVETPKGVAENKISAIAERVANGKFDVVLFQMKFISHGIVGRIKNAASKANIPTQAMMGEGRAQVFESLNVAARHHAERVASQ